MRRAPFIFSFILCNLIVGFLYSQKQDGYKIKVKINGLKDTVCYLAHYYGEKPYLKDTARLDARGQGAFEGKTMLPGGIYLIVLPRKVYFEVIVADEQHFSIENDTADFIHKMKVSGSKEMALFLEYQRYIIKKQKEVEPYRKRMKEIKDNKDSAEILLKKIKQIDNEVKSFFKEMRAKSEGMFFSTILKATTEIEVPEPPLLESGKKDSLFVYRYYKEHFFDNINFSDGRLVRTPFYHNRLKQYFANLVLQHPDTINKEADMVVEKARASKELFKYTIAYITSTYEASKYMGMDAIFVHMAEKYYMTGQVPEIDSTQLSNISKRAKILSPLLIGKKAPNLTLPDTSGKWIGVWDVKAKQTVVIFWDPGCGHCKKEVPRLHEIYKKWKPEGVEVFSVNIEADPVEWKKFIKENNLDWVNVINLFEKNHAYDLKTLYDIYSTPVIYLLDENKVIRAKRIDSENVELFLKQESGKK